MEELQCSLLGFSSASIPTTDSRTGDRNSSPGNASDHSRDELSGTILSLLHPSELSLVREALPLGEMCRFLRGVATDVAVGRGEGLYHAAVGAAVAEILVGYEEAVAATSTPSDVAALRPAYATAFSLLTEMVRQHKSIDLVLASIRAFVTHREIPPAFRVCLGEAVWMSLLYTIAHYVAHGVVLHGRRDFFISVRSHAGKEEHTLHSDLLPPGVSVELGALILAVGRERRALLSEAEGVGHDYLERLAMGTQDEAADAVFRAIYSPSLCAGGALALDELETRVEAARQLWSKALWLKVGDAAALRAHLAALHAMFLCHRGDLWHAFVEAVFPAVVDTAVARAPASEAAVCRAVADALTHALGVAGLGESPVFERFGAFAVLPLEGATLRSVEETARAVLGRVRGFGLRYAPPRGMQLILSSKALEYYQRIFSFHIARRVSLHALHSVRRIFTDAAVTNRHPTAELRRCFAVMQLLLFLHTTLGYHMQVDVIMLQTAELERAMAQCKSVQDAKRRLDRYVWNVAEGSFITEGSAPLLSACESLFQCAIALYVLCTRYRLTSWAVDGAVVPAEVAAALAALETRVQQDVVAAFTGHLSGSATRATERALWARLDFNRFLSAAAPPPRLSAFPQPAPTRQLPPSPQGQPHTQQSQTYVQQTQQPLKASLRISRAPSGGSVMSSDLSTPPSAAPVRRASELPLRRPLMSTIRSRSSHK